MFWRIVCFAAYHARMLGLTTVCITERYVVTRDDGRPIHGIPRAFRR
jgi:hypothetical protein